MITYERLTELLDYNPDTGIFTWKVKRSNKVPAGSVAGCLNTSTGYVYVMIDHVGYLAHRLAFLFMTKEFPPEVVDHINSNRSDNRFCNLRAATFSENQHNRLIGSDNTSGFKGVNWDSHSKKWRARIRYKRRLYEAGSFSDRSEAAKAAAALRIKLHKEFTNHG